MAYLHSVSISPSKLPWSNALGLAIQLVAESSDIDAVSVLPGLALAISENTYADTLPVIVPPLEGKAWGDYQLDLKHRRVLRADTISIMVTKHKLYLTDTIFTQGLGLIGKGCGIVTLNYTRPIRSMTALSFVGVHEAGHAVGLQHCNLQSCIMREGNVGPFTFCQGCTVKLHAQTKWRETPWCIRLDPEGNYCGKPAVSDLFPNCDACLHVAFHSNPRLAAEYSRIS